MYQVFALSSLGSVAGHQDIGFGHDLAQHLAHLRIRGSCHCAHITVLFAHQLRSPGGHLLAHQLIEGTALDLLILEFAAGGIGSLHKDEDTLLLFFAHIQERIHSVRPKIRIHGYKVLPKGHILFTSYFHPAQMSYCIGCGRRTNVSTLDVADHHQSLFLAVLHRLLESHKPRDPELLIHGDLRLYRRDQIPGLVHDLLVKLPDGFRRAFQRLTILCKGFLLHLFRHIFQHRVQAYHDRRSGFFYLLH